ncbi:MAG: hypothetical protein OES09_10125 [Gammaproteobacteria bacterium]|nr:hypothetical protein [Gammaproteobacteria bacterium]
MNRPFTLTALTEENRRFARGRGVSANCASMRFLPAFHDTISGETHLSLLPNGSVSPVHLLDGLPEHWILERDHRHRVTAVKSSIISGFVRNGHFYTREDLVSLPNDA